VFVSGKSPKLSVVCRVSGIVFGSEKLEPRERVTTTLGEHPFRTSLPSCMEDMFCIEDNHEWSNDAYGKKRMSRE
jgi:hypothetical protein